MHAQEIWANIYTAIRMFFFHYYIFLRSISLGWISFNAKHTVLIIKPNMSRHQAQTQLTDNVRTIGAMMNIAWW